MRLDYGHRKCVPWTMIFSLTSPHLTSPHLSSYELQYLVSTAIAVIVLLLIVLTIGFEEAKHKLLHAADKNTKPIINSLFGEMTVLGFLSLFTFCVTQMGVFERMSTRIFGEEGHEELLEIFESVHYMLFGIMLFFLTCVLVLVTGARRREEVLYLYELGCLSLEYMQGVADRVNASYMDEMCTWRSYVARSFSCKSDFFTDLLLYYGIRNEFLLDRSLEPPFHPMEEGENRLDNDFNFARYLGICLGHTLGHVVELDDKTWAFFGILTILYYILLMLTSNDIYVST